MSPEQIRLECLKFVLGYQTGLTPSQIVNRAREFEAYVSPSKDAAPEPDKADQPEQMYVLKTVVSSYVVSVDYDGLYLADTHNIADAKRFTFAEAEELMALRRKNNLSPFRREVVA